MSVFRRKYRNSKGQMVQSPYFSFWFMTPDKRICRGTTRCRNKRAAETEVKRLQAEEESSFVGEVSKADQSKALPVHIEDFVEWLRDERGCDKMYCYIAGQRLNRMADEAGWTRIAHITLRSFEDWRKDAARTPGAKGTPWQGKTLSPKTLNQYLDIARRFLDWAKRRGRVRFNQLVNVEHKHVIHDPNYRRAGTPEELAKALAVCDAYQKRFWRFAVYMPLRRRTLKRLQWEDSHEADADPWMAIRGEIVKGRQFLRLPLRKDIALMLAVWREELNPRATDLIFPRVPDMDEWRAILEKAKVPFDYGGRRRWDLHAMRKTAIKWMQDAGVPLVEAMIILGHRDQRTTAKYYAEAPDPRSMKAVEKMPKFEEN